MQTNARGKRPSVCRPDRTPGGAEVRRAVRGVTLVEMLIVIVIVLSLTAMTIPVMAPMLSQRRTREAARMVSVFINGARNRALQTGRPYGFMMERIPGLEEGSVTLSYAEVPDPYCGTYINSTALVRRLPVQFFSSPYNLYTTIAEVRPWVGSLATGTIDIGEYWGAPGQAGSINPGDQIQFNFQGDQFFLNPYLDSGGGPTWIIGGFIHPSNDPNPNNGSWIVYSDTYSQNNVAPPFYPIAVPYQIYRIPVKSPAGSMSLPEGTVIDLNFSGMAPTPGTSPATPPFHARTLGAANTTNNNANDANCSHYYGSSVLNGGVDSQPVMITFRATGLVGLVYQRVPSPDPKSGVYQWRWLGKVPQGPIHLLIGKREHLPATVPTAINPNAATLFAAGAANNWLDMSSLWVTIFPQSGMVVTSENAPVTNTASSGAVPYLSLQTARSLSLGGRSMGGR
jgi:type II secretory pathway pseudopilin PulG